MHSSSSSSPISGAVALFSLHLSGRGESVKFINIFSSQLLPNKVNKNADLLESSKGIGRMSGKYRLNGHYDITTFLAYYRRVTVFLGMFYRSIN